MISPTSTDLRTCEHCQARPTAVGRPFAYYCAECRAELFNTGDARSRRRQLDLDYGRGLLDPFRIDDHNAAAVAACLAWWGTPRTSAAHEVLFIHGPVGSGKTTLAFELVREICLGDEDTRFVIVRDLLADSRRAMTAGDDTRPVDDLIEEQPGYLVLDDLGAERPTDWAVEEIARIVEHRYRSMFATTIVTSNYSPAELAARLGRFDQITGQRIVSRLRENALVIKLDGPDRRVKPIKEAA